MISEDSTSIGKKNVMLILILGMTFMVSLLRLPLTIVGYRKVKAKVLHVTVIVFQINQPFIEFIVQGWKVIN
jgi:hypothetical protein